VNPLENFYTAIDSLKANALRSSLALLGIVIGVFSVMTMVGLGELVSASIQENLRGVAGRSISVQPAFGLDDAQERPRLKTPDAEAFRALGVVVLPQVQASVGYTLRSGKKRSLMLSGTLGELTRLDPTVRVVQGRYFGAREARLGAPVAVINPPVAEELFGRKNPVGRRIRLLYPGNNRVEVTVVGVLENGGLSGLSPQVLVPIELLWRTHPFVERGTFDSVRLVLRQDQVSSQIERNARRIVDSRYGKDKIFVQSAEAFQEILSGVTRALQFLLAGIGSLSLLVGGIGIMNIMLASVTERIMEIGLRKALGATPAQIREQFLIEASLLTFIGGLMATVGSIFVLWLVHLSVPFFRVFVINPFTVIMALVMSIVVGLFFGVWPAARAAALDPIEALRSDG
jgi:putative ABC transport system permease protein